MPPDSRPLSAESLQQRFAAACQAQAEGHLHEAREGYLFLLTYLPESALLHYNIGLVWYGLREFPAALEAFALALVHGPKDADTLFNLALCQKKTGDCAAAMATYRQILVIDSNHADCWYNLGGCHRDLHDDQEAIACYQRVLAIDSGYLAAVNNLAYLHHRAGEATEAIACYRRLLVARPEDQSARYLLAALLGLPVDHAPDAYVRDFFDTYADGFEHSLIDELGYDNPRQLHACLSRCPGRTHGFAHGLDLGCGTGLGGVWFKGTVAILDGVDLSRNMLVHAARKGCYTALYPDSIGHHLAVCAERYDFFLATDVFIYVGELRELFAAARAAACPQALFCFSTEHLDADGFRLQPTGRFAYSPAYIHQVAAATGWTVVALEAARLRRERDGWIAGDLWVLRLLEIRD